MLKNKKQEKNVLIQYDVFSRGEEIANAIIHGIGILISIAGLIILIVRACTEAPLHLKTAYVTAVTLFGSSAIFLYLMSCLFHALTPVRAKNVFMAIDYSSIYFLIAGTYSAFCLSVLYGVVGWVLFGIIWLLATIGITFTCVFGNKFRNGSLAIYLVMGWLIVFVFKPLKAVVPSITILFLILGGMAYSLGTLFFAFKKVPWFHPIWHVFVLTGTILHFFSLYYAL